MPVDNFTRSCWRVLATDGKRLEDIELNSQLLDDKVYLINVNFGIPKKYNEDINTLNLIKEKIRELLDALDFVENPSVY